MRLGIIGCGLIGTKRAAAAMTANHQVVLVTDPDKARAEALATKAEAKIAKDWNEVIAADVDIIIVATPHNELAHITLAAVQSGKHVLVEKPAGRNAAELIPVAEAAKKHKRFVKVGFNHRFHPALQKAYEIFKSGALGEMMYIRGRYGHGGRLGMEKEWRCQKELSGGGELIDQGAHLIDLSRWFLGDLNVDYAATPIMYWPIKVEDNCFLALRGNKGEMAWLHATWTEWKNCFSFEIYGRNGKLAIEGLGGSYGMERLTHYQMLPEMGPPNIVSYEYPQPDTSWEAEFAEFVSAVRENREPSGNIHDALAMMQIIDTVYKRDKK